MTSGMLKPRALRRGDRVAVLAPASPFDRALFDQGVKEVGALGFEPVFEAGVFERQHYVAGAASNRAAMLRAALRDPKIAGIVVVRGGYGSAQLLPFLDSNEIRAARKPLIGYSDLTALLAYFTLTCELVCFHGPMVLNFASGVKGYDRESFLNNVTGRHSVGELNPIGLEALIRGKASGPLFGGTLTQIVSSLGTPYAFKPPSGYVLLLDDIGERPYRIDRMLTQLSQAGVLAKASAVVCSEFPGCSEISEVDGKVGSSSTDARTVVADLLVGFDGPVVFGFPSGHTTGPIWTLPLGVEVTVHATPRPRIIIEEAAVE